MTTWPQILQIPATCVLHGHMAMIHCKWWLAGVSELCHNLPCIHILPRGSPVHLLVQREGTCMGRTCNYLYYYSAEIQKVQCVCTSIQRNGCYRLSSLPQPKSLAPTTSHHTTHLLPHLPSIPHLQHQKLSLF